MAEDARQSRRGERTPGAPTETLPVRMADSRRTTRCSRTALSLLNDRGNRLSELAVVSEDETAYGGLPDSALVHGIRVRGHDVQSSTTRSARAPLLSPRYLGRPLGLPGAVDFFRRKQVGFRGVSLIPCCAPNTSANVHENTDTVQPFSGTNLALTQEAQLYGIVNTLKTHGIRYVVLRSTNSLDYLFLTRFLHRAYPTAYIVTTGSDLLFGRSGLDGVPRRGCAVEFSAVAARPRLDQADRRSASACPSRIRKLHHGGRVSRRPLFDYRSRHHV